MPNRPGRRLRFATALANRRFQSTLVLLAGTPIIVAYLWRTLITPTIAPGSDPVDLFEVYVPTGRLVATGQDPYSECMSRACWRGITDAWTDYPPVVSWLSQPLWHLDHTALSVAALLVAQACVAVFIATMVRALGLRDWRAVVAAAVIVCSFPPLIDQIVQRNAEVLLLALSGVWFLAWMRGDRWWGGIVLGAGVAMKLVQGPLLLLSAWRGRLQMTIAAVAVFVVLWAVGSPQYLPEFFFRIVPELNNGTGYAMDIAPIGAVARLLHPASLFGQGSGIDPTVRLIGLAISLLVTAITAAALHVARPDSRNRPVEASAVVAATPLVVAVVRPGHLLLLLLPMLVILSLGWRERRTGLVVAVAISWILMGPAYLWYTNVVALGVRGAFVRPGEEMALAGVVLIWLTAVAALRLDSARAPAPWVQASRQWCANALKLAARRTQTRS